jgi:hypothetical protein
LEFDKNCWKIERKIGRRRRQAKATPIFLSITLGVFLASNLKEGLHYKNLKESFTAMNFWQNKFLSFELKALHQYL